MKLFKNYKKLYLDELENRRKLITQNSRLSKERIDAVTELAKLRIALEDVSRFYAQEKEAKEELLKQRKTLKRKITMLEKELNKNGE